MSHRRLIIWLADKIPTRLLYESERLFLAFVILVIGTDALFFGAPTSLLGQLPEARWLNREIGLCYFFGGIFLLIGTWRKAVWQINLGDMLTIMGSVGVLIGVWIFVGTKGLPIGLIYFGFAVVYALNLLSSAAARWKLKRRDRGQ